VSSSAPPDPRLTSRPGTAPRLLVVEDDLKLVRALQRGLEREGYAVEVAGTGQDALARATGADYDVVVLDVMLPDIDGFAVCETLRRRHRWMPVLMLTARGEVHDRIRGLDGGADDYLAKPFDFGELLARLRALVRRGPSPRELVLSVGGLTIDRGARTVTSAGRRVELTPREFALLECLARNAGEAVSRAQLLGHVWEGVPDVSPNTVDVYIGYLRRKLDAPDRRRLIHTVRGVGYMLEPV
jgi:two-component system OmpR family response regulator